MGKNKFVGVILAAGQGSRITPLNLKYPKPLLPVCNKPIMEYQIDEMRNLGIRKVYIVIGHLGNKIQEYFKSGQHLGLEITYVKQKEQLGIAHAVGQLEPYIKDPFLLFLGDIFYVPKNLRKMFTIFKKYKAGAVLAIKKEKDPEVIKRNFSIVLGKNNLVNRVIEKPRYVINNLKGSGIYLFDLPIFDAIRNTPRIAMRDEYEITTSIQLLIDYGYRVYPADVIAWDMNITFAQDLLTCNLKQLEWLKQKNIISPSAKIDKKAKIHNSVIGDKVLIKNGISIIDSVIINSTKILTKKDIINYLITPEWKFDNNTK
jgi:dTDP-glucose pyrophosphorylase